MTAVSWTEWNDGSLSLRDHRCLVYATVIPEDGKWLAENIQPSGYYAMHPLVNTPALAKRMAESWLIEHSKEPIRIVGELP